MTSSQKIILIFRRDHRLYDNKALEYIYEKKDLKDCQIIPIFIFDSQQVSSSKNKFKSNRSVHFMCESLLDLNKQLNDKLCIFEETGNTFGTNTIEKLTKSFQIKAVVVNKDYTPYAEKRDKALETKCKSLGIEFHQSEDYLLLPIGSVLKNGKKTDPKKDQEPYTVYTWFYKTGLKSGFIDKPKDYTSKVKFLSNENLINQGITGKDNIEKFMREKNYYNQKLSETNWVSGGRTKALERLSKLKKEVPNYSQTRDKPSKSTTNLGAYIHFGNVSMRECYYHPSFGTVLKSQLWWRDYYYYILYYFPKVLKGAFYEKYNKIPWKNNPKDFKKWKEGKTGFPIIDAGMRQLEKTGYTHNRIRMTVASFAIKDLLIDWRKCEKFYATKLIDYNVASNNGNWQWVNGSGGSNMPYYRVFNPWEQSKKHDPQAEYIKEYIPELKDVPSKDIHNWDKACNDPKYKNVKYPKPMLKHEEARDNYLKVVKNVI